MLIDLSLSHCQCSFFPGSIQLGKVIATGHPNSSSAGDGILLSIGVALICSRNLASFPRAFFYCGFDVSHMSFNENIHILKDGSNKIQLYIYKGGLIKRCHTF